MIPCAVAIFPSRSVIRSFTIRKGRNCVSELQFPSRTALLGELSPRRIGRRDGPAGVTVHQRADLSLALVMARRGMRAKCIDSLRASYDLDAPVAAHIVH